MAPSTHAQFDCVAVLCATREVFAQQEVQPIKDTKEDLPAVLVLVHLGTQYARVADERSNTAEFHCCCVAAFLRMPQNIQIFRK